MNAKPRSSNPLDFSDSIRNGWLSALADGESSALEPACRLWHEDSEARRAWHTYHLIGDVMRSDELAISPARDAAFMKGLRTRLAAEPVVVAPAPESRRASAWMMPATMVAGFVAVAGVLMVARTQPAVAPAAALELGAASASGPNHMAVSENLTQTVHRSNGQALITDLRLDEFLRAHRSAGGGVATSDLSAGGLRRVDVVVPDASNR